MTKFGKTVAVLVLVVIVIGVVYLVSNLGTGNVALNPTPTPAASASNTPAPTVAAGTVFNSSDLGFSFSYPDTLSVVPQNFMDTTSHKTLVSLGNADKSIVVRATVLMDPKTGKPVSTDVSNYEQTLINDVTYDASGAHPKSFSEFQLKTLGTARFAYIKTGLNEGVLGVAYYVITPGGIVRFSETSQGVDWTNPSFDPEQDAGHLMLKAMLATFKVSGADTTGTTSYNDPAGIYSATVPGWKVNSAFSYDALGPNISLKGVSFTVPASLTAATNLSSDSYISIEKYPSAPSCTASAFVSTGQTTPAATNVTINGTVWNVGQSADAGAGNLYQERVYVAKHGTDCYGVRLFLHSGNVDNYDPGARQQFDTAPFQAIQDKVVQSFQFLK